MALFKKPADIKVGCIGYGGALNMGRQHLNEMIKAGMTPVAVCDIDTARLKVAETDFPGIKTFSSVAEMLKKSDVNLLAIITPHNTHAPLALQCLKAGRHVVCEKPFAITTAECDAMIKEAGKRKLVISTYHNRHWDGHILEAVKRIGSGVIGDLVRVDCRMGNYDKPGETWRGSKTCSGGVMYDWGVHLLEYALQLIKSDIVEVSGYSHSGFWAPQTKWGKDCIEDEANAVVRFKNGCMLNLRISKIEANGKPGIVEFTGTKGQYVMDFGDFQQITHPAAGETVVTKGKSPASVGWKLYQNIADHLTKNTPLIITGEWSRRPIQILDLAVRSAKLGKALPAKYK
jgi:predicted dehydrogenase